MDKDELRKLITRFMDGQTTVEEEDLLGAYFRTHDVPKELSEMKQMFAYFDKGMPEERETTPSAVRQPWRRYAAIAVLATAAAVAALFVLHSAPSDVAPLSPAPAAPQTALVQSADSTTAVKDTVEAVRKPQNKRRRTINKYRYTPAPPKTYMAQTSTGQPSDPSAISRQLDRQLADIEHIQSAYIADSELMQQLTIINNEAELVQKNSAIAMMSDEAEEETY